MNTQELETHTERMLDALCREFAENAPADEVTQIGWDSYRELLATATINTYIPLLVHRQTRETLLLYRERSEPHPAVA